MIETFAMGVIGGVIAYGLAQAAKIGYKHTQNGSTTQPDGLDGSRIGPDGGLNGQVWRLERRLDELETEITARFARINARIGRLRNTEEVQEPRQDGIGAIAETSNRAERKALLRQIARNGGRYESLNKGSYMVGKGEDGNASR